MFSIIGSSVSYGIRVMCLVSLAGAAISIKKNCDKTHLLSQQKYACCDKTFVVTKHVFCHNKSMQTNICCDRSFVLTKIFCRSKHTFVMTKDVFCRDKHMFVATNTCLSQQKFCHDKDNTCGSSYQ